MMVAAEGTGETKVMDEVQLVNVMRFDLCSIDLDIVQDYFHLSCFRSV